MWNASLAGFWAFTRVHTEMTATCSGGRRIHNSSDGPQEGPSSASQPWPWPWKWFGTARSAANLAIKKETSGKGAKSVPWVRGPWEWPHFERSSTRMGSHRIQLMYSILRVSVWVNDFNLEVKLKMFQLRACVQLFPALDSPFYPMLFSVTTFPQLMAATRLLFSCSGVISYMHRIIILT